MKKIVVKLELQDNGKAKQKALKIVSTMQGIDSISVDMKEKKLTVVGTVDPVNVVSKLRKYWHTHIDMVGPAKETEKEEGKAAAAAGQKTDQQVPGKEDDEQKKEGGEQGKKGGDGDGESAAMKDGGQKKKVEAMSSYYNYYDPSGVELVRAYRAYNPHMTSYYHVQSMEVNPNDCGIC